MISIFNFNFFYDFRLSMIFFRSWGCFPELWDGNMVRNSWGSSQRDPDPAEDMKYEMFCADRIEKSWSGIGRRPGLRPTHEPSFTTTIRYCSCRAQSSELGFQDQLYIWDAVYKDVWRALDKWGFNVSDWDNYCPEPRWVIMCCIKYNSYSHNIRPPSPGHSVNYHQTTSS